LRSLRTLEGRRIPNRGIATAVLLPADSEQQAKMGLTGWSPLVRSQVWDAARNFLRNNSLFNVVTWRVNGLAVPAWVQSMHTGTSAKARLVQALRTEANVLILFAHGDRLGLTLPDGTKFTIADLQRSGASDTLVTGTAPRRSSSGLSEAITLPNRPVVLLFSCEGAQPGQASETSEATESLAIALKGAGAAAVWGFEHKVDAREAVGLATKFADRLTAGDTVLGAIRRLDNERVRRDVPRVRLKISAPTARPVAAQVVES
jgi:hypothetical protein